MFIALALSLSAAAQTDGKLPVRFDSEARGLVVHEISDPLIAASSAGTAVAYQVRDLCTAPCVVEVEPGFHSFYAVGNGGFVSKQTFEVRDRAVDVTLVPGLIRARNAGSRLAIAGVLAGITGATLASVGAVQLADNLDPIALRQGRTLAAVGAATVGAAIPMVIGGSRRVKRNAGSITIEGGEAR